MCIEQESIQCDGCSSNGPFIHISRAGSVLKSKPKPHLFEETELIPKPTFWPLSASFFWPPGAGRQERICQ